MKPNNSLESAKKLIIQISKKEDKYFAMFEIFKIFFLIINILDKEKFNMLLNNVEDTTLKIMILKKMLSLNDISYISYKYQKQEAENFNKNLSYLIKKINFLQINNLNKI